MMRRKESPQMRWFEIVAQMSEKNKAYVIVTVLEVKGSSPREEGAKMIVFGHLVGPG